MGVESCMLNEYFSDLKNTGYVDYTTVLNIVNYLALKEILKARNWEDDDRRFINYILNELESKVCLISYCLPCKQSRDSIGNSIFIGVPTMDNISFENDIIKEILSTLDSHNLFSVL